MEHAGIDRQCLRIRKAISHLTSLGHRDIAFIKGPEGSDAGRLHRNPSQSGRKAGRKLKIAEE
jgi:DNA-binding LacI/PurR family transcriptional regulator